MTSGQLESWVITLICIGGLATALFMVFKSDFGRKNGNSDNGAPGGWFGDGDGDGGD